MLQRTELANRLARRAEARHKDSLHFTERALRDLPLASEAGRLTERQRQQVNSGGRYVVWDEDKPYWACRVGRRDRVLYVVRKLKGSGRPAWHPQGRVGDKPLAEYRSDAETIAARLLKGEDPRVPTARAPSGVLRLGVAFENCLEAKAPQLAASTVKSYRSDFDAAFGDWRARPFASITHDMVLRRHQERSKESRTRADGALRVMRLLWRYTMANAALDGKPLAIPDPLAKIKLNAAWNGPNPRRTYLDGDKRPAWVAAVRALPDDKPPALTGTQRDALLLLAATGLRLREGLRLTWREVGDLRHGVITLAAERMKGGREHTLPIPKRTLAMLKKRRAAYPEGEFVFAGADGRPLDRISKRVLDCIGVTAMPHDLRRTCATWLGTHAPGYVVKQILSHADPSKSNDVTAGYVGRDLDALRVWLQQWENVLYLKPRRK